VFLRERVGMRGLFAVLVTSALLEVTALTGTNTSRIVRIVSRINW
jgi:hypothetical protein